MATISVGAKNSPATNTASDSPRMFTASSSGKVVTAVATPPYRNNRGSGTLERNAPNASPARHEPMAYTDNTTLAAAGCPCCWAKATLTTSTTPTMVPMATINSISN